MFLSTLILNTDLHLFLNINKINIIYGLYFNLHHIIDFRIILF